MKEKAKNFEEFVNESKKDEDLELVQRFMKQTTEDYDDYDWDGKVLALYSGDDVEHYTLNDIKKVMNEGKKESR
jgi:hypothetical protein